MCTHSIYAALIIWKEKINCFDLVIVLLLKTVLNDQMLYNIIYYGKLYYENVIIRKNGLVLKEELLRPCLHTIFKSNKIT